MDMKSTQPPRDNSPEHLKRVGQEIVDAAVTVHKRLGPGLLDIVYEACMTHELTKRGLAVQAEIPVPVEYDGLRFDCGLTLDLLVEGSVVVEMKAVEKELPVHEAQLTTFLRLTGCRLGYLINFNVASMRDGIKHKTL